MQFKTTIEIVSEATDKNEAVEIVGEYLSGNLVSGVAMKCNTRPVSKFSRTAAGAILILCLVITAIVSINHIKLPQYLLMPSSGISAIQPPLKTSSVDSKKEGFKKEWKSQQDKEALDLIKKSK